MRGIFMFGILALLCHGCAGGPPAEEEKAEVPPAKFESVPELKDVMGAMIEDFSETIWNAALEDSAPKSDSDWQKLDHAAIGLVETSRFMMTSHLAKDQGAWKTESQKLIDIAELCRNAIKEKNRDALIEAGNKMNDVCTSCHMIYFNPAA